MHVSHFPFLSYEVTGNDVKVDKQSRYQAGAKQVLPISRNPKEQGIKMRHAGKKLPPLIYHRQNENKRKENTYMVKGSEEEDVFDRFRQPLSLLVRFGVDNLREREKKIIYKYLTVK